MKTYVISGATGTIGRPLVDALRARGERVIVLSNPGSTRTPAAWQEDSGIVCVPCGLEGYADPPACLTRLAPADAFIHLAWAKTTGAGRDDAEAQYRNIGYTLDAVRLAHTLGCSVFVGAGSQAEYGRVDRVLTPDRAVQPESGYGIAKFSAGRLSALLCRSLGIRHVWARILSVYGIYDAPGTLISYLISALAAGERPALSPCGQIWDYLYADDAAQALIAMAERGRDGGVYCLGSGRGAPLREYVESVRRIVAPDAVIDYGARPYYPHQPMLLQADLSALTADTGFVPTVEFAEGVRRICAARGIPVHFAAK